MAVRGNKAVGEQLVKNYKDGDACPLATYKAEENLKNRNHAIDEYGYGPLNPSRPNDKYWREIAGLWGVTVREAKSARCGNCAAFIQTPKMMACIRDGMAGGEEFEQADAEAVTDAANLGYCWLFHFKCAGDRTCHAWLHGGPVK